MPAKTFPVMFPSKTLKKIQTKELKESTENLNEQKKAVLYFCECTHWKTPSSLETVQSLHI